jgi:pimeloyl-ACP methyl ester carboxylesterase
MQKSFIYRESIISYRVEGKGNPLLLIHGFGEDSHIWDQQISFLKDHCLLIIPDLPGSGKSSLLDSKLKVKSEKLKETNDQLPSNTQNLESSTQYSAAITIDDYASCIHAILQEEQISSCIMLGHSMGGYITLAFAEKYPSLLKGFGLIHSTAFADTEEKIKIRERSIDLIAQYGAHAFLKTAIPNLFGSTFKKEHYEKVDELMNAAIVFTKEALQQYYRAMILRTDKTTVLQGNPLPILFVIGTEDAAVPMEDMLQQTSMPLHSHIHILQDVGHMSMWEAPEELNQFILSFISA